jgi:predicted RNA-binding protein with PIN domain
MAFLIDGYNLLHAAGVTGRPGPDSLRRSREALLNILAASIDASEIEQSMVVFDATEAPPGLPNTTTHHGLTVYYARNYASADAMLEQLIAEHHAPRSLTVVSSDHRVQRAARRRKAKTIDSDRWFAEVLATRRQQNRRSRKRDADAKPSGQLSPDEVAYWLEQFS